MIDKYTVEVPISMFGKITEEKLIIPGPFIPVTAENTTLWKSTIDSIYGLLLDSGLKIS